MTSAPAPVRLAPPPPRWATVAAHVAALTPLPSALWRLGLALGLTAGYTAEGYRALDLTGWGVASIVLLSVVTEAAALLTLGLVQRWGEVVPGWIPFVGRRVVHPWAATVPAAVGAVLLTVIWTPMLFWWVVPHDDMTAIGATVVGMLYLPLVAWGPLLAAVTWSYHRRRRAVVHPLASTGMSA